MRTRLLPLLFLIVLNVVLAASSLRRGHEWGDDFASYIMQAESILTGTTREFAEHNSFTIFESSNQIGPVAYPWGYPLILTPAYAVKGNHPLALKLPGLLFYAGFLLCLFVLMKTRLTDVESLLAVSLFAFNPLLIRFLDQILSDIPFLFFSTLALWLMTRSKDHTRMQGVLLGVAIFLAYFIRTTGGLLLAAFLAAGFIETLMNQSRDAWRRYLQNAVIVCAAFGVLFLVNLLLFPQGETSHLLRLQEFTVDNASKLARSYFDVFGSFFGTGLIWQSIYYALLIVFLIGAWTRRKQDVLFIVFFLLWMTVLIIWPSWQGPRFIFPLLPVFVYFVFMGMKTFVQRLSERYQRTGQQALYGFWALIVIMFMVTSATNAVVNLQSNRDINGPYDPVSREVYEFIQKETPTDSVIVFFKPRAMRLMTGRDSILSTECDRILKGDYLVLSKKVGNNQQIPPEEIGACGLPLEQVLSNARFIVYQIQK